MKLSDGVIPFTDEWTKIRIGKITASLMHKVFVKGTGKNLVGVGGTSYINQKIGEILTQIMADSAPETEDVLRGLGHERFGVERYVEITNEVVHDSLLFEYNSIAAGTTDGQILKLNSDQIKAILEVKCPRPHKHIQVLAVDSALDLKKIDPQYYNQGQSNILFADAEYADFISYCDEILHYDLQIRIVRIYPDFQWRSDFAEIIEWIAEYMAGQLEKILLTPQRNLTYRILRTDSKAEKLLAVIDDIKNISI